MLLTQGNYYSAEANKAYMSNSQYKAFRRCEAAALAELRGEYAPQYTESTQKAFLIGGYVDAALTGDLDLFRAQHPEMYSTRGKTAGQLKSEFLHADYMIERVRREFPECYDLFEFADGCICDQKVMANLDSVWDATERRRVSFIEYYGYDIQGAIYRELEGNHLPFILAIGTKQDPPDLQAIHIPDSVLSDALREVGENAPRFQKIKLGLEPPTRCEKCAYCRMTRRLTRIEEYDGEEVLA